MSEPRENPSGPPTKATRKIPPLVWIIVAGLVLWLVVAMVQRGGTHTTPQGGTAPQAEQGASLMPAAPATGDAPATPSSRSDGDSAQPPAK